MFLNLPPLIKPIAMALKIPIAELWKHHTLKISYIFMSIILDGINA